MSKKLIIFGTGKIAEVVYYYAKEECGFDVAAFTVDDAFKTADSFLGLPVVPFSTIGQQYPPESYDIFVAVGYHDLNRLRAAKCEQAAAQGYSLVSIISPAANLPKNVTHGRNCFVMPPAIVHPCVKLEDDVFIWSGAVVGHHSTIRSHAWITSGCSIAGNVTVGENTFLAINATVGHSVAIGAENFIGANALITKNTTEGQVYIAESSKAIKLNSRQFLKFSSFSSL